MYAGFAGQAGRLSAVRQELEALLRPVVGLHRFVLLETSEGMAIVTEANSRAASEEAIRRAEEWMRVRVPALAGYQPLAATGEVIVEASGVNPDRMVPQSLRSRR
jgi:hypothetical protein